MTERSLDIGIKRICDTNRRKKFERLYRAELADNKEGVAPLADLLQLGPVTQLRGTHDPAHMPRPCRLYARTMEGTP